MGPEGEKNPELLRERKIRDKSGPQCWTGAMGVLLWAVTQQKLKVVH